MAAPAHSASWPQLKRAPAHCQASKLPEYSGCSWASAAGTSGTAVPSQAQQAQQAPQAHTRHTRRTSIGSLPRHRTGTSGNALRSGILPISGGGGCCPAATAPPLSLPALLSLPLLLLPSLLVLFTSPSGGRGCTQSALENCSAACTTAGWVKGEATCTPKWRPARQQARKQGGSVAGGGHRQPLLEACTTEQDTQLQAVPAPAALRREHLLSF